MRTPPPPLLPILRSQVQGKLLALLYLHPESKYSLTEAARLLGVSAKAIHVEANRLVEAGYIKGSRIGNVRQLQADTTTRVFQPLASLLAVTYGPLPVISELLSHVPGVDEAYIFGSWARRYSGVEGPIPNDIDVLVVGTSDEDDLYRTSQEARAVLGREVNVIRVSQKSWRESTDAFLDSVRAGSLVDLIDGATKDELIGSQS